MYPDLRRESAVRTVGSIFPATPSAACPSRAREKTWEIVNATIPLLPADKPRYVMGVGTPEEIVELRPPRRDMMDCVIPTRAARHGLLFTSEGKLNIKMRASLATKIPLTEVPLQGLRPLLTRLSQALVFVAGSPAQVLNTVHNLAHYLDIMRRVRETIISGEFAVPVLRV